MLSVLLEDNLLCVELGYLHLKRIFLKGNM